MTTFSRFFRSVPDALLVLFAAASTSVLLTVAVSAWTAPSATAPSGNVGAPFTVGATSQTKGGSLGVNGLAVFGNSILQANSYLNFGTTSGTSSYGIRDSAGVLQFKNQGGQWSSLASTTASFLVSGQWQQGAAGAIYFMDDVGINTSVPTAPLDVNGTIHLAGRSAEPAACDASHKGAIVMTGNATLCICNGTAWVTESNRGACAWGSVSGSQEFTSSGMFVVQPYNTLTVQVWGGGGGGGESRRPGANGGQSSWNGVVTANGGNGGDGYNMGGSGGTASGGDTNTTGNPGTSTNGGSAPAGGAGGGYPAADGTAPGGGGGGGTYQSGAGGGGSGGYSTRTYSAGQLTVGGSIPVVVGSGGAGGVAEGGGAGYTGGNGAVGRVTITWN